MADLRHERLPEGNTVDEVVAQMLRHNDWHLVSAGILSAQANARLQADTTVAQIAPLVISCYAELLYRAFCGQDGEERQRAAYNELLRYIYRLSRRYGPELMEDEREEIAGIVIAELYDHTVSGQGVRKPGAFIAIVLQQTRNVLRSWRGAARRLPLSLDAGIAQEVGTDSGPGWAQRLIGAEDAVHAQMERYEQTARIRTAFAAAVERSPRARLQLLVVWLHALAGLDYADIATSLGVSVPNARVLYNRGKRRLREDPELRVLAAEIKLIDSTN